MRSTFGRIAFVSVKVFKIVKLAWNSLQKGKQCAFHRNCTKRSFQVMRSTFWQNRIFERQRSQNRENCPQILFKTEKQEAFHENSTKRSFQVMRSTVWPNRIFSGSFPWKFYKRLFSGYAQHGLAKSHFFSVKVHKIVKLAWNWPEMLFKPEKTVRLPWKLYKTRFSGHAQHVLAKSHFWASKFSKSWNRPKILFKTRKQCGFY